MKFENNDRKWTKLWLPSEGRAWVQVPWDGSRESSWCWCTSSLTASHSLLWVSSPPAGSTGTLAWCRNTHRTAIYIQKINFKTSQCQWEVNQLKKSNSDIIDLLSRESYVSHTYLSWFWWLWVTVNANPSTNRLLMQTCYIIHHWCPKCSNEPIMQKSWRALFKKLVLTFQLSHRLILSMLHCTDAVIHTKGENKC